jgi:hypothetical protein
VVRSPFKRSTGVPADVVAALSLPKGEKVLAATLARDGSWLVGTRDALLVVATDPSPEQVVRIPWQLVERADWDRDAERLRVLEVGQFGAVRPSYDFEIEDPGRLLQLIRERVTASVVLQRRVVVNGKRGLYVVARRPPRGSGEITWAYEFDENVDPADPAVMAAAERGLRTAAEELGL